MQFRSDIPGRPETQVGRWHAMCNWRRDEREKAGQGGEVVESWPKGQRRASRVEATSVCSPLLLARPVVPMYDNRSFSSGSSGRKPGREYDHHALERRPLRPQRVTLLLPSGDQGLSSFTPFRSPWNNHLFCLEARPFLLFHTIYS